MKRLSKESRKINLQVGKDLELILLDMDVEEDNPFGEEIDTDNDYLDDEDEEVISY